MKRTVIILLCASTLAAAPPPAKKSSTVPGMDGKELCKENFDAYKLRLMKDPADTAGWQELRVCADLLKRWGEARMIAQDAIDHGGAKRPEPHLILGLAAYNAKDYSSAVDELRESVRLKDDQASAYFQLGLAYLHLNQNQEAVGAGVRAVELDPDNPAYHHQLAFSYFMTNQDEKCNEEAKRAIELDANDVAAYKILSSLYSRQGRQGLADQMAEEAIHANGRLAAAHPFVPDRRVTTEELTPQVFSIDTPPSDTEQFLKAQWERMKQKALAGDVEATASYYSIEDGTQDVYRRSFQKMGPQRMQETFKKLGALTDCDIAYHAEDATCKCSVAGAAGSIFETKVKFEKNPDHIWRIKSF